MTNRRYVRSYSELMTLKTFDERFAYLDSIVHRSIGETTFGSHRYLYERFLRSDEWKTFRAKIIVRDKGLDMGVPGHRINESATVHHINPITLQDLLERRPCLMDPENVITMDSNTHNLLHNASKLNKPKEYTERRPNDTCPWKEEL